MKVLIVESEKRDADHLRSLLEKQGAEVEVCLSRAEAETIIKTRREPFQAVYIYASATGPPLYGFQLLRMCLGAWPDTPVIITLDVVLFELSRNARALGARDVLKKPIDAKRFPDQFRNLFARQQPESECYRKLREKICGQSPRLLEQIEQLARVIPKLDATILLLGETGTGKDLFARSIHEVASEIASENGAAPLGRFVSVNLAAISKELFESELFGHEKGSFTGALELRIGRFEEAMSGTLFLNEIGELPDYLQAKLLSAIDDRQFRRVGGKVDLPFAGRLICATNQDIIRNSRSRKFREDLLGRISRTTIEIPPLRERREDIPLLMEHFLARLRGGRILDFAPEVVDILNSYHYPLNVREMEGIIQRAVLQCDDEMIGHQHLDLRTMDRLHDRDREVEAPTWQSPAGQTGKLIERIAASAPDGWIEKKRDEAFGFVERAFDYVYCGHKLEKNQWNITRAAEDAGLTPKPFRRRCVEAGLLPSNSRDDGSKDDE